MLRILDTLSKVMACIPGTLDNRIAKGVAFVQALHKPYWPPLCDDLNAFKAELSKRDPNLGVLETLANSISPGAGFTETMAQHDMKCRCFKRYMNKFA